MPSRSRRRAYPQHATQLADLIDVVAILAAAGLIVLVAVGRGGAPRTLLALAFTLFVPGRAIVTNWAWLARWSAAAMSMILSLGILSLLATVTLWASHWQPTRLFLGEAAASIIGLATGVVTRHLRSQHSPPTAAVRAEALALLLDLAMGVAPRSQQQANAPTSEDDAPTRPDMLLHLTWPGAR